MIQIKRLDYSGRFFYVISTYKNCSKTKIEIN